MNLSIFDLFEEHVDIHTCMCVHITCTCMYTPVHMNVLHMYYTCMWYIFIYTYIHVHVYVVHVIVYYRLVHMHMHITVPIKEKNIIFLMSCYSNHFYDTNMHTT